MSINVAHLEQSWLQAEALADVAKREVKVAVDELQRQNGKVVEANQVKVLLSSADQARARQAEAERTASAAFDLLWQAKSQGHQSVHA
jgi:NADPH-dependent 7-cyano-7-deazaguanine reductase QueF-like protein